MHDHDEYEYDEPGDEDEPGDDQEFISPTTAPIPEQFYSEETGDPFATCIDCGTSLDDTTDYLIQKNSNGRETVFEFAICTGCAANLHASYSQKSRQAIVRFFEERTDPEQRARKLLAEHPDGDLDTWLGTCITCSQKPQPGKGFATAALCSGFELVYAHLPIPHLRGLRTRGQRTALSRNPRRNRPLHRRKLRPPPHLRPVPRPPRHYPRLDPPGSRKSPPSPRLPIFLSYVFSSGWRPPPFPFLSPSAHHNPGTLLLAHLHLATLPHYRFVNAFR